jgi:CxxC motif-containing protein
LIDCITKVTKNCRYKGLEFPRGKEYSFDEIPALKAAGWTKEEYERQKQADE